MDRYSSGAGVVSRLALGPCPARVDFPSESHFPTPHDSEVGAVASDVPAVDDRSRCGHSGRHRRLVPGHCGAHRRRLRSTPSCRRLRGSAFPLGRPPSHGKVIGSLPPGPLGGPCHAKAAGPSPAHFRDTYQRRGTLVPQGPDSVAHSDLDEESIASRIRSLHRSRVMANFAFELAGARSDEDRHATRRQLLLWHLARRWVPHLRQARPLASQASGRRSSMQVPTLMIRRRTQFSGIILNPLATRGCGGLS